MNENILITDILMSKRCSNLLKRSNINTLDGLLKNIGYMHYQMDKYRNLGLTSLMEIDSFLENYGYNVHDILYIIPSDIGDTKKKLINEFYIKKSLFKADKICFKYGNGYLFYTNTNNQTKIFKFMIEEDISLIKKTFSLKRKI